VYRNILLPTDGLGKCKFGTCHGIVLANELGAKLTAVHITGRLSARELMEAYHRTLEAFGRQSGKGGARRG